MPDSPIPSTLPQPRGRTNDQLYISLRALVDALNQRLSAANDAGQDDIDDLQVQITALTASLTALQETVNNLSGSGLTSQQSFELSLVTAVTDVLGSLSNGVQQTIDQSQQAAEATIRSLLEGARNTTSIRVEQAARLTAQEAFASQITALNTQIGTAQAQITEEITARTTGDTSLASSISTVSSTLAGNVAQVQVISTTLDGVLTRFSVALNSNGQVIGLVALDGTAAGTTFTVVADKFLVAQPDQTGGAPVPVFAIGSVGGTTKIGLRGDMIVDGSISAQKINASTLSAITGNIGDITTGTIRNSAGTIIFDLTNQRWYRPDGRFDLDARNLRFRMGSG